MEEPNFPKVQPKPEGEQVVAEWFKYFYQWKILFLLLYEFVSKHCLRKNIKYKNYFYTRIFIS